MADLILRPVGSHEFELLGRMNRELIEDERHRNPMNPAELAERARRFIESEGWSINLIIRGQEIVGFATFRHEPLGVQPPVTQFHLRHFFIARQWRRRGLGREAFQRLLARCTQGEPVVIDVLEANPGGRAFWSSMGFEPYALRMERKA
jgi:predicted acetyltransferase